MYVRVPVRLRLCPDDHRTEGLTMHTTFDVTVFMDVRHLSSNTPSDTSRLILRTPIANLLSGEGVRGHGMVVRNLMHRCELVTCGLPRPSADICLAPSFGPAQLQRPCSAGIGIAAPATSWHVLYPPTCETPLAVRFATRFPNSPVPDLEAGSAGPEECRKKSSPTTRSGAQRGPARCATQRPSRPHTSMAVNQLPCETFATRAEMASWNTASLRAELQTLQTRGSSVRAGARTHADAPTHAHVADDKLLEEVCEGRGRAAPLTRLVAQAHETHGVHAHSSQRK